jgi:hypothetical protein
MGGKDGGGGGQMRRCGLPDAAAGGGRVRPVAGRRQRGQSAAGTGGWPEVGRWAAVARRRSGAGGWRWLGAGRGRRGQEGVRGGGRAGPTGH